jgi:poly(hydroxyalkanoate) depolymerase family esterase
VKTTAVQTTFHRVSRFTPTRPLLAGGLMMTLLSSACVGGPAARAGPAFPAAAPPSGVAWHTHTGPEGSRRYRLSVPERLDARRPAPLVVMLHGCTQDPDDFAAGTRLDSLAAERGVVVAWPEQPASAQPQKCWTWYDPAHQARGAGEPAIVAGIAAEVATRLPVDADRVYLAGLSAGGAMAANVAAAYPERFAAVAVHSGIAFRAASSVGEGLAAMGTGAADVDALARAAEAAFGGRPRPPLLVIHGAADPVVNVENARQLARQWAGEARWSPPDAAEVGGRTVTRTAAGTVQLHLVDGLGHAWSGGSPDGSYTDPAGPAASREVLDFLLRHRRGR